MKIDKAIDAMRHLLMTYENDRGHIHRKINSYVNTSEHFDMEKLIGLIDQLVTEDALLERKGAILTGFLTQIVTQITSLTPQPSTHPEEQS